MRLTEWSVVVASQRALPADLTAKLTGGRVSYLEAKCSLQPATVAGSVVRNGGEGFTSRAK